MTGQGNHAGSAATLEVFPDWREKLAGKTVVDYGCGPGSLSTEMARTAKFVYAVDIRPWLYPAPRPPNVKAGLPGIVPAGLADLVVSFDSFEHYGEPEGVLAHWRTLLRNGGTVCLSFGPPWYHPYGAHMAFLTRLPWLQLWCPERLVMAWRARHRKDGARRYEDVEGGLNRMSVARCDRLIAASGFRVAYARNVPIRGLAGPQSTALGRELWTSRVIRVLVK